VAELGIDGQTPHADARGRLVLRALLAGLVASIVLIVNIVSFAALMFPGALAAGASTAVWAMLIGSGVTGLWVAWRTSLPPMAVGIDSPTGAVLVLLSASCAAAVAANGGTAQAALQGVLLLFAAATALSGALLLALGLARWGNYMRFVPFFVVAGFLAATGWLLIAGGARMASGHTIGTLLAPWSGAQAAKLACALATLGILLALRRWAKSPLAMPAALIALAIAGSVLLKLAGLSTPEQGWVLPSLGSLAPWSPLDTARAAPVPLPLLLRFVPEVVAVAIIALVSVVTKTSTFEVTRKTAGDLDCELRSHGAATLAVAPFGGIVACMQLGSSRVLEDADGAKRMSAIFCAAILLVVGLTQLDLPSLIPLPLAAGLVFYLGWNFLVEALARPLAQRAWLNLLLSVVIAAACVHYGYLVGVIGGVIGACMLFAASYSRTGVVRQHMTRAQFAGNVSRSAAASRLLIEHGDSIQLYWLAGHVFFGSSEGLFERVRRDLAAQPPRSVQHVVLDFGLVTGVDASATLSLTKLRNHCRKLGAALLFAAIPPAIARVLQRDGFLAIGETPPFADINAALAWCEERTLQRIGQPADDGAGDLTGFESWLQQQLGPAVRAADFIAYLERSDVAGAQVLYAQGDPSDEIDLVAAGRLVVDVTDARTGRTLRARSITTHSVVGEMGFFRRVPRSATVSSEGPATRFTLTRANYERMHGERPDLAVAFADFLLRTLADRINMSERMAVALVR
jgi:SulP family sulfate permease